MVTINILLQHIIDSKKVFFENNNETMYSTVAMLQDKISEQNGEIKRLKDELLTYENRIAILKNQIQMLSDVQSKEIKDLLRPYDEENLLLKRNISELENALKKSVKRIQN